MARNHGQSSWNLVGFLFGFIMVALLLLMSACNTIGGAWDGAQLDWRSMSQARQQDSADGETMRRMRELGWSDDHLLDDPSYGVK